MHSIMLVSSGIISSGGETILPEGPKSVVWALAERDSNARNSKKIVRMANR